MSTSISRNAISGLVLVFAMSMGAFAQTGAAAAPATSATKIGVIDVQRAIIATYEGQRDFEALQKKFEPKSVEIKSLNDEIENLKKQLTAQQDKLNDDEKANRARTIDQKQRALQRIASEAQEDITGQQNELAQRIGARLLDIIDKYARANGLAMVIDVSNQQSPVLWASEQVNITPAVVAAYNEQSGVPAPAVNAPAPAKPAATPAVKKPVPGKQ